MFLIRNSIRGFLSLGVLSFAASAVLAGDGQPTGAAKAQERFKQLSHRFIENQGQWSKEAKFLAKSKGLDLWVAADGIVFDHYRVAPKDGGAVRKGHAVKMVFEGASNWRPVGGAKTLINTDFMGHNKARVRTRSFDDVFVRDLYDGISLRTYIDGGRPRYDFIVSPGADASQIRYSFKSAQDVKIADGELKIGTDLGPVSHGQLFAYQILDGKQRKVSASFVRSGGAVSFRIGAYDRTKELVIDPLVYGSYYGGDNGFDEVRSIVTDSVGGVYMTGSTQASQFPVIHGPYSFNLTGTKDAFVAKLQGDAYSHDYAAYIGGTLDEYGQFIQIDPFGNIWVAGRSRSSDFPGRTKPNRFFLRQASGGLPATGGTFRIQYNSSPQPRTTAPLPWNATPAQVQAALEALPGFAGNVTVSVATGGNNLPGTPNQQGVYDTEFQIDLAPSLASTLSIISTRTTDAQFNETNEGLPARFIVLPENLNLYPRAVQTIVRRGSIPTTTATGYDSRFALSFTNAAGTTNTTPFMSAYATAAEVQAALNALGNIPAGGVTVTGGPIPNAPMQITFVAGAQNRLQVIEDLQPQPTYTVTTPTSEIFITRFAQSTNLVLDPIPTQTLIFGGLRGNETLAGFKVVQDEEPTPGQPVEFVFTGQTLTSIDELSGTPNGQWGFVARYNYNGGFFAQVATASGFITGGTGVSMGGLDLDLAGNAYVAGQVNFTGNADTAVNPVFATTAGVFPEGRLLRNTDIFVRKYSPVGQLLISALIGGNNHDLVGGLDIDLGGNLVNAGSGIAVDAQGAMYVTGISQSFNFPRTRGVYGEVFTNDPVVTVTKINPSATALIYSTHLRTTGVVRPVGIDVNSKGEAFVTGNLWCTLTFPVPPSDPNQPTAATMGTIQTTSDAIDPTYTTPTVPELPTTEGFLNVIDAAATQLLYGTYIGGDLDDKVFGPYLDSAGDVWLNGWTDAYREYVRGTTLYTRNASLPTALISPLAFKAQGDAAGRQGDVSLYGALEGPFTSPQTISGVYRRDGYVVKLRLGLPTILSLELAPSTLPGGLGEQTAATVTLTSPAPPEGADITFSLDNLIGADFDADPNIQLSQVTVTIPAGGTTATVPIYTNPVAQNTSVFVRASYLNDFKIAQLIVVPWLQQLTITPVSTIGGQQLTGRVTLFKNAPAGGVPVNLLTSAPNLISFPGGPTVTVPAGQTNGLFTIDTAGVAATTNADVTAALLGVNKTQTVTLLVANLQSLSFNPPKVAGGSVSTATLRLDGKAGSDFAVQVTIDIDDGTQWRLNDTDSWKSFPANLTFPAQQSSMTFQVKTVWTSTNTSHTFWATRYAQGNYPFSQKTGTLFIDSFNLVSFSIDPTTVDGGATAVGTVRINAPAPAGGVVINLTSSDPAAAPVPAQVFIPSGAAEASFNIDTAVLAQTKTVTIAAQYGAAYVPVNLTINGVQFALTLNPASVVGGSANSTGTVTLSKPAPAGGVTFTVTSSDPATASVPATVTVPAGQMSVNFTVTTSSTSTLKNVVITVAIGSASTTATLQVRPVGLASIAFNPNPVKGGFTTVGVVTLDAPAPTGGVTVTLSQSTGLLAMPVSIFIPEGQTQSSPFTVLARRVSRTLATVVRAQYGGSEVSTVVTVLR